MNRKNGTIGGSSIGKIMGLSRWGGPVDAYLRMVGITEDNEAGEPAYWGKEAQPAILKRYNQATGNNMAICDITYQHPAYEFLHFTPDALRADQSPKWPKSDLVMEMKETTVRDGWGEPGSDVVPDEVALQCQFYIMGCEAERADVAVHFLRPRHEFAIYHIPRSEEVIKAIIDAASDFYYNHIIPQIPPPLDSSDASKKLLNHLYPRDVEDLIPGTFEVDMLAQDLKYREEDRDKAVEKLTYIQNLLKEEIADHAGVMTSLGKVTWKKTKDREVVDWKAAFDSACRELITLLNPDEYEVFHKRAVQYNTKITPGSRVFRAWFKKED